MLLDRIEESLLLAAWFRGGDPTDGTLFVSNADQIVTLSLFYTGDITADECAHRFSVRSYLLDLYDSEGELSAEITVRDRALIQLLKSRPDLIEGGGDWTTPCYPTYRACRLTVAGRELVQDVIQRFPAKPDFPNWPDKRPSPVPPTS